MTREEKIQWMITRTGWNPKAFEVMKFEWADWNWRHFTWGFYYIKSLRSLVICLGFLALFFKIKKRNKND